jgi:hypothetical protein
MLPERVLIHARQVVARDDGVERPNSRDLIAVVLVSIQRSADLRDSQVAIVIQLLRSLQQG